MKPVTLLASAIFAFSGASLIAQENTPEAPVTKTAAPETPAPKPPIKTAAEVPA